VQAHEERIGKQIAEERQKDCDEKNPFRSEGLDANQDHTG
jgi:hypothetical protein